ncbi:MAG: hypothetical protein ABI199_02360 [Bacteroidia bacterium]
MHTYLSVLLEWANSDPRWTLLEASGSLLFGILTFPPFMKRHGDNFGNNDLKAFFALSISFTTTFNGILFLFFYFRIFIFGMYMAFAGSSIYAAVLYLYYFKWTDKGDKFAAEQKKKQQEMEQKRREEDEARKKKYGE